MLKRTVFRTSPTFGDCPRNVLRWYLDITQLAVDAVLRGRAARDRHGQKTKRQCNKVSGNVQAKQPIAKRRT